MPRIQTFLSNSVIDEVSSIVESRRAEGASSQDASLSNTVSMLVELGLRVYRIQRGGEEDVFNQTEFNKVLLENAIKARLSSQKVLGILSFIPEISGHERFSLSQIVADIQVETDNTMARLFPSLEGDDEGDE